ncbi:hypothetical protein [Hyphomonas sp.]|uniref:hypothetical protein n=1 Tax=Hyphomonas sp. TaxID=87 RepID=UPI0030033554
MSTFKETFNVEDWTPPKGRGWRGPSIFRDERGRRLSLFSHHEPWSITWRRFTQIEPQKYRYFRRRWFAFYRDEHLNGSGKIQFAFLRLWVLSYHWQQHMRYPPAPVCTICNNRIDPDGGGNWCGNIMVKRGCAMPEPDDKRAVYAKWESERGLS